MVLIQLLILGLIIWLVIHFIIKLGKSSPPIFIDQEHFTKAEPVFNTLPKSAIKNSHWYTHTFMRPRRKG